MLKEAIALAEKIPSVSSYWRASSVGECETFLCHERLGHESLSMTGRVRHMLDDGVAHERDIVDRLKAAGITVLHSYAEGQVSVTCSLEPLVSGHPDGVLDLPGGFSHDLDYTDENFKFSRFMLLEITAPNHFTFLRLKRGHMREILWRKYVQIQMYLNSEEIRSYSDCCVVIVKSKNTSELYEEGMSINGEIIADTLEKLRRVEDLASRGEITEFRCSDWRRGYCRYKHLCYGDEEVATPIGSEVLRGEFLSEAEMLRETAMAWQKGKLLKLEGEDLIADSREQFADIIGQYGCKGLTVASVRAMMIEAGITRHTNYDLLENKYPDVYVAVVDESARESYVRVSD